MAMKRRTTALLVGLLGLTAGGCQDFLDVNTNPNAPQLVSANLYLPPMIHWTVMSQQLDGRGIARYTQQLMLPTTAGTPTTWDRMGYDAGSDFGGEVWRTVYWNMGQNLVDMMTKAEAEQRWDVLGVGQLLKAWGWLAASDLHGEIIVREAFDPTKFNFSYDSQQFAYEETLRLLTAAIANLKRTDGAVDPVYLGRGDRMYNGDRTKWLKLAYGLRAMALNHYSNKANYNAAAVIANVDSSFTGNVDDALVSYPGASTDNADLSFLGRTRNNFTNYRQTQFVVNLLNGTQFGTTDPRLTRMLSPSPDGVVRGMDPNVANGGTFTTAQAPGNPMGYAGTGGLQLPGRYVFSDKARLPILSYAQLQFIKAEAAFKSGNRAVALDAYTKGVSSHIDFVNERNREDNQNATQITAAEKSAFLASPTVVPTAGALTLTHIMSQKYIAQWGWGHIELWMDMRRYNYTDVDPSSGRQVYPGFAIPTNLFPDNNGKVVERLRPRFNSEYVWNREGLATIGGLDTDFHTKPMWITEPGN